jgi:DNA modification methylase
MLDLSTIHQQYTVHQGDVLTVLRKLPAKSVHVCVTSPPYWRLRDYGVAGQLGLEANPRDYLRNQVKVFRAVRRVLRDDGTLWMNMGDAHVTSMIKQRGFPLKGKMMMPHRLAIALQDDGWYVRQDIVWWKQQPQPETVSDRPTTAHEYFFLLSKSERYYYDADAIAEACSEKTNARSAAASALRDPDVRDRGGVNAKARMTIPSGWATGSPARDAVQHSRMRGNGSKQNSSMASFISGPVETRNKRSVWPVYTDRMDLKMCTWCKTVYTGAEYAKLKEHRVNVGGEAVVQTICGQCEHDNDWLSHFAAFGAEWIEPAVLAGCPEGGTVLDCYSGTGTTMGVAVANLRKGIGIELNPDYIHLTPHRVEQVVRKLHAAPAPAPVPKSQLSMLDTLIANPSFEQ